MLVELLRSDAIKKSNVANIISGVVLLIVTVYGVIVNNTEILNTVTVAAVGYLFAGIGMSMSVRKADSRSELRSNDSEVYIVEL